MWKQPVSHKYRSVSVTMKKKGAIRDEAVCPCTQRWWLYLTTSIELAPDLKKSVESSITGTLLKIRAQMTCTEKATFIKKGCVESHCPFPEDTTWGFCSLSPWVTNGQWIWQKVTWASYLTILAPGKMAYNYMWVFVLDKIQMTSSLGFWMVLPLLSMSQLHPSPPHQPRTEK